MPEQTERDYVIGTHDEEIERLGLQHRVWRPRMLDAWNRAGISKGSRVMDMGAGPGYATVDLAEIVGPEGEVVAVERSARFLRYAIEACRRRGFSHVRFQECDLILDTPDASGLDAVWLRWVASFVSSPPKLVERVGAVLRAGGIAVFHEYIDYGVWRLAPRRPAIETFVERVIATWRASGGEPDIALSLPTLLKETGFRIKHIRPLVFTVTPQDYIWRWPAAFIETYLQRMLDQNQAEEAWVETVRRELREAEADPESLMITPMVLEIIAERVG